MNVTITNTKHQTRIVLHKVVLPQDLSKNHRVKIRGLCPDPGQCCKVLHDHPLQALAISSDWMEERPVRITFTPGRPYYINPLTVHRGIDFMALAFDPSIPWRQISTFPIAPRDPDSYTAVIDPKDLVGEE